MLPKKTIENYVNAVLDRYSGVTYPEALEKYKITPNQFFTAVDRLREFIPLVKVKAKTREILERIPSDSKLQEEMFDMGEEFVRKQYDRISGKIPEERQTRYFKGTFLNTNNIDSLVYYALISHNPKLASTNRKEIIYEIENLPVTDYYWNLGLNSFIQTLMTIFKKSNPVPIIIEAFDRAFQRKTGNPNLFDKTQENYLELANGKLIR